LLSREVTLYLIASLTIAFPKNIYKCQEDLGVHLAVVALDETLISFLFFWMTHIEEVYTPSR
jgi:hypothetical protein